MGTKKRTIPYRPPKICARCCSEDVEKLWRLTTINWSFVKIFTSKFQVLVCSNCYKLLGFIRIVTILSVIIFASLGAKIFQILDRSTKILHKLNQFYEYVFGSQEYVLSETEGNIVTGALFGLAFSYVFIKWVKELTKTHIGGRNEYTGYYFQNKRYEKIFNELQRKTMIDLMSGEY